MSQYWNRKGTRDTINIDPHFSPSNEAEGQSVNTREQTPSSNALPNREECSPATAPKTQLPFRFWEHHDSAP